MHVFFFQAEDGIRDYKVTGVQTCALPISRFRQAWCEFFKSAGLGGRMPRIIRGKGRMRTFDLFRTAVENPTNGTVPLLLVDSEGAIREGYTVWQHLKLRDGWDCPAGASEDQAHLMVQVMETWFLADGSMLRAYFGSAFNEKAILKWPDLESVPKDTVFDVLSAATAKCKVKYAKGRVSYDLLSRLNPAEVEIRCVYAQRLLSRL